MAPDPVPIWEHLADLAKRRGKPEIDQDRTEASLPPEQAKAANPNPKRKRGRPPGSGNRPKPELERTTPVDAMLPLGSGTVHQSEEQAPKEIYTLENGKLRRFVLLKMPVYVPDEE